MTMFGVPHPKNHVGAPTFDYARGITPTSNVGYTAPQNATDGDDTTVAAATSVPVPQWLMVDVGRLVYVSWSRILWPDQEHQPSEATLDYSLDNSMWLSAAIIATQWIPSFSTTGWTPAGTWETHVAVKVVARYWRIYTTQTQSPGGTGINVNTWSLYS